MISDLINNKIVIAAMISWLLGQGLKFPFEYLINKRWDWTIMFSTGGLPSSHSAVVTAVALSIGLIDGFDTSLFALAAATGLIVIYDAAGVRRQAGFHAERINQIIRDFLESGHFEQEDLKEMLGHSPFEVVSGIVLGVLISLAVVFLTQP
jgi:acid phosphatase family membrane protein YuiD